MSSDSLGEHFDPSLDLVSFTICTDQHLKPKPRKFSSTKELTEIIKKYEDSVQKRIAKHLENKYGAWAGMANDEELKGLPNEVKGDLGVIRDLSALERLGFDRGAVNQVNGRGYDVHAYRGEIEIEVETKNIDEEGRLSLVEFEDKIEDRFPSNEDAKACSGQILRVVTIPRFTPNGGDSAKIEQIRKQKGIHVIETGKQVLTVNDAKESSKVLGSKMESLFGRLSSV